MNPLPLHMDAVVWRAPGQLALARVQTPLIEAPTDAIVRVSHASTCGTDLHAFRGAVPGFEPGTVMGHEFVGNIVLKGDAVHHHLGVRVRCSDFIACGSCEPCVGGRHSQCRHRRLFGFSGVQPRLDGGLAEYVRVPWADTVLMPFDDSADARIGLLAADVLPTAHGALERASLQHGERIAVIGAGPVGLLVAQLARLRGADVTIFDVDERRCEIARLAGLAAVQVEAGMTAPTVASNQHDVAVDAVGGENGLLAALARVRCGGRVVGVGSQAREFAIDWASVFQREISLHFVIGNPLSNDAALAAAMSQSAPMLDAIFRDAITLADVPGYFPALQRRERFKAVVTVSATGSGRRPLEAADQTPSFPAEALT